MSSNTSENGSHATEPPEFSSCSPFSELSLLGHNDSEPIAIVGMACRLPGHVESPSDFWNLMMARQSPRSLKVPSNRFNIDAYYHSDNERPGSFNVPGGYFLDGSPEDFDPTFFGITPIEAMWMDPQQRKLLEVVYETFENAGIPLEKVAGTSTGCFIGSFTSDFQQMSFKEHDFRHAISATGVDPGILANRIGHVFDLRGPSAVINTACSSSLYALHAACSAIRNHDCEGVIVGGSNLILTVDQHMNTAKLGVLSPTSQCHTFDESADGYARAEGVGALYLKPLSAAYRDGDPVRAIIRSSATNSNGKIRGVGISHPSVQGQADVIRAAHEKAGLDPRLTTYVECHGTGTPTGDPKELQAISQTMSRRTEISRPVLVGSVKPNVGHSEASSSVSTIIKTVLALENGIIPPTAGVTNLNAKVPWREWHVQPVTEPVEFPPGLPVRRIGVNASGYGGTNAHAILESAKSTYPQHRQYKSFGQAEPSSILFKAPDRPHLLLFSAHDRATLTRNIGAYSRIRKVPEPLDLAYTLANHRSKLATRAFAICRKDTFSENLLDASHTIKESGQVPTIAFAFTGQGAQWPGMGAALFAVFPSFAQTIQELDQVLARLPDPPTWNIKDILLKEDLSIRIHEAEISQPLCTAVQIGLVRLLNKWNVHPVATIGHSSGEIAAAFTAGYLSAEDAILVAYYRGKVMASATADGAMLAVGLGADEAALAIEAYQGKVVVACHNSPQSVTLSGDSSGIKELKTNFEKAKVLARDVRTGGRAYHSHHMKLAACQYQGMLHGRSIHGKRKPGPGRQCEMISSVMNSPMGDEPTDSAYWAANLESPVLFNQAMLTLAKKFPSVDMIVEIGPHPALLGPIRQICALAKSPMFHVSSLKRGENDVEQVLKLVGELWTRNSSIDISSATRIERSLGNGAIEELSGTLLVDLPSYQWNYAKKYFSESRQSQDHRGCKYPRHDILGRRILGTSSTEPQWRNVLRLRDLPWLKHHNLGDEVVFPAAGYFAMTIEALAQTNSESTKPLEISSFTLRDLSIESALVIPDDSSGVETILSLRSTRGGRSSEAENVGRRWYAFSVSSFSARDNVWNDHASGTIGANMRSKNRSSEQRPSLPLNASGKAWYRRLQEVGFNYGPTFQDITKVRMDHKSRTTSCDAIIKRECGLMTAESKYVIHPSSVDCCLQAIIVSIYAGKLNGVTCGIVPTHIDSVTFWIPKVADNETQSGVVNAWTYEGSNRHFLANSQLLSHDGKLLLDLRGVHCVAYEAAVPQSFQGSQEQKQQPYWQVEWKPDVSLVQSPQLPDAIFRSSVCDIIHMLRHKMGSVKILDMGDLSLFEGMDEDTSLEVTVCATSNNDLRNKQDNLKHCRALKFDKLDLDNGTRPVSSEVYDLIISPESIKDRRQYLENCRQLLVPGGLLLTRGAEPFSDSDFELTGFRGLGIECDDNSIDSKQVLLATPVADSKTERSLTQPRAILLVTRTKTNPLLPLLTESCGLRGHDVRSSLLEDTQLQPNEQVIIIDEAEGPMLSTLHNDELHCTQALTKDASRILWVTFGGLMSSRNPEHALVSGLTRSLRSENVALNLVTIDFDARTNTLEQIVENIMMIARQQAEEQSPLEAEYAVDQGIFYVSRLTPNRSLNESNFKDKNHVENATLESNAKVEGIIKSGKLCFQIPDNYLSSLEAIQAEVKILAIGLNEEDVLGINGVGYRSSFGHEIGGVVKAIGSEVSHIKVGDKVIGFSFDQFSTVQTAQSTLLCPLREEDSIETMISLPAAFSTAAYGLEELGRIEAGETVIILDNAGPAGLAAVQICQLAEADILIVTPSENTYAKLINFGILADRIILAEEGNIPTQVQRLTKGLGADVIFGSKAVDSILLQECAQSLAPYGRVVLFGGRSSRPEVLDSLPKSHGLSVSLFDMPDLCERRPRTAARLLQKCVRLYTNGKISPVTPVNVRSVSQIDGVVSSFSSNIAAGKTIVSFESNAVVRTIPSRQPLRFDPNGAYLLVGCLGGLGRSLTSWMIDRGARHLAFMSRSGSDSTAAAELVSSIQAQGVEVTVWRGDVARKDDVEACVQNITQQHKLRGIVNAAMVLNDGMFQSMTLNNWSETLSPKVQGSLNLHHAVRNLDLDFFILTSSTSGTLGTPGQSNYAAANTFQDALARYRRNLGLPAVSLVLPMILGVGHVADHPEIEDALLRKGIYGIHEDELLAAFEAAMTPRRDPATASDHIIVGLEPARLATSVANAETTDAFWLGDRRFAGIVAAIDGASGPDRGPGASGVSDVLTQICGAKSAEGAVVVVAEYVRQRLVRLLGLEAATVQPDGQSISGYGLDSMIGTEFRNWLFREFGVTVPYQRLLAPGLTVKRLAEELFEEVRAGQPAEA